MPGAATNFISDKELACWLALDQVKGTGISPRRVQQICEQLQGSANAWGATRTVLKYLPGLTEEAIDSFIARRESIDPGALLEAVRRAGVAAYPICHPYYPERLREIHDPPSVLYIKGVLRPEDLKWTVGVVGTRRPSAYGQKLAREFASALAESGVTIVSGMAVGIDSYAHRAALEGEGKTVAVLGCGPDQCYPTSNRPLYQMLVEEGRGAVVSEYFPGTKPEAWRFPARNRIISGLSQGVLVVEAGETSGALITARLAFEQNREVFAIPGRIDNPMSRGTNALIARSTARLCTDYKEILQELNWVSAGVERQVPTMVELYGREKEVFDLLSGEPTHFDHLCEQTGMPAGELSATLTMLELAGVVTRHPGDFYSRLR